MVHSNLTEIKFDTSPLNTPEADLISNMTENCKLPLPWLTPERVNKKIFVIVGGSPSMRHYIGEIKRKKRLGAVVCSLNGSLKFLLSKGLKPDFHCQFDAMPASAGFLDDAPAGITYLIGSMSNPAVFDKLKGRDVVVWHGGFDMAKMQEILRPYDYKPVVIVGGGSTVGLTSMFVAAFKGYRKIIAYGLDGSFTGDQHHAYDQKQNEKDRGGVVHVFGGEYICAPWMYRQAMDFKDIYARLEKIGCSVRIIGNGLLPDMCNYFKATNEMSSDTINKGENNV